MRASNSICLMVTNEISATTFYRGYLSFLREHGWDVSVVASSNGMLAEFGRSEGVAAYDLQMSRNPAPWSDLKAVINAVILLRKIRPTTVVVATPKAALLGLMAAWITRVPVRIYQMWGLRLEAERGARRVLYTVLEKVAARLATQVVANSPSLARAAQTLGIAPNIDVLGSGSSHGVDTSYFDRCCIDIPAPGVVATNFMARRPQAITVGYVGRVHQDKGIVDLLEAVKICARNGLLVNLLVVGQSEDEVLEQLISDQNEAGLDVLRVGAVKDTRPFFLIMDMHCLPTHREGFPNVVLEAASLRVPTITTRATGSRDSVVPGVTGILVDVKSPPQLATAIQLLASDRTLREEMAASARLHVVQNFQSSFVFALQEENLREQRGRVATQKPLRSPRGGHAT